MPSGERERIRRLLERGRGSEHLVVANGDDAAVLRAEGMGVLSVDASVEGTHFRASFADWRTLGRRAAIAALSDLSAMGAAARALLSSLVLPKDFADDDFDALTSGVFEAADEAGAVVAGGNLAAGSAVSIHTTVIGTCEEPVRRAGASAGERLYLSGRPADASLGLACLLRRDSGKALPTGADVFIERWRRPTMHRLPSGATAAIDLSDGLASDVRQLTRASRVDCELERASLEGLMGSDFLRVCDQIDADPLETLLQGGESYVLAYAAPDGAQSPEHTAIGTFTAGEGKLLLEGQAIAGGFDHFAQSD